MLILPHDTENPDRLTSSRTRWLLLALCAVVFGGILRYTGIDRDVVNFVHTEQSSAGESVGFYSFHPDERNLVSGALNFDDPLNPAFTMYGNLPLYLLQIPVGILQWAAGPSISEASVYRTGRSLSAALSMMCLISMWLLAIQLFAPSTAALSVLLLAVAPAAIQQAHFYTVDSLFCFLTTSSLAGIVSAVHRRSSSHTILAGVLIGLSASVRLNALLLIPVFLVAFMIHEAGTTKAWKRRLLSPRSWIALGSVLTTMAVLQPYLLLEPSLYWTVRGHLDFAHVMQVVSGAIPQFWTLQYLGTTPYLYQWTHLLPLGIGWPMTTAAAVGGFAAVHGMNWRRGAILLWVVLYLLTTGSLLYQPIRFLLPIIPPLLILAAELCRRLWSSGSGPSRWVVRLVVFVVISHAVIYGLAFLRIWTEEDSRVQVGRWIASHVPEGAAIAVENGAFPMHPVIDTKRHRLRELGLSTLFDARGYLLTETSVQMLRDRLGTAQYVAITDVNRLTHVLWAPEVLPVVTSFYLHLVAEQLGYRLISRTKVYPELGWFRFNDDDAEHSFLGFDHPAVLLFERNHQDADEAWDAWADGLTDEPFNVDALLHAGVAAMQSGDFDVAQETFAGARDNPVSRMLLAIAKARSGLGSSAGEDLDVHPLMALSLAELGLREVSVTVLRLLHEQLGDQICDEANYGTIIEHFRDLSYEEQATEIERLSNRCR